MSEIYITRAEYVIFEACLYLETHPDLHPTAAPPAVATSSGSKGHKISFRLMTHEDCRLWFQQLEDVFTVQDITWQTKKFVAFTTLLSKDEAFVI